MHSGSRCQVFASPNAFWKSWVPLVLCQISKNSSKSGKVLSALLKKSPESLRVESFPCLHRFYFMFIGSLLLFAGPELSVVCQPHGADVGISFPASILPVIIPKTWSPCLSLHVLRNPLGLHDYFLLPLVYPLMVSLVKAKLWPQS